METKRKIIIQLVTTATSNNIPQWFKDLPKDKQKEYLKEHPNSKIAKQVQAEKPKASVTKTPPAITKEKPTKKDSYADVPEADKKQMMIAKERGHTVPPAWREVWTNPDKDGDLQVKGKDSKGRTQYLYSVNFRTQQDMLKFERLKSFTKEFPKMNHKINKDMETSEEAKVLYLISLTGFRIGDDKDTGAKHKAYGASNLTSEHIKIEGTTVHFDFIGKEGVHQQHSVEDAKLAKMLKGKTGRLFDTKPVKIHKYLDGISEQHFKVKDFRTYVATSTALETVANLDPPPPPKNKKEYDRCVSDVCKIVSKKLGNTPKMARDSYIDPLVFKSWETSMDGKALAWAQHENQAMMDFIESNHFSYNKKIIDAYKTFKALPAGKERKAAYLAFQAIVKDLKLVNTQDREKYIESLKQLERSLKAYTV
jgi:DNA topoisomerase-1